MLLLICFRGYAQNALASRVLVVYASNDPDSSAVAAYYAQRRGIAASNLCPLTLPDITAVGLSGSEYTNAVELPVRACLDAVGRRNVLYIVLAYVRPYVVSPGAGLDGYAVDSYLADIWDEYTTQNFDPYPTKNQPYYIENQSQGNVYLPFQSLAAYREIPGLPVIYSVWRLDGASSSLAMALVDNAIAAEEAGGLINLNPGQLENACIDMELDPTPQPDAGYRAADWDLFRASEFVGATNQFNVIADENETSFGIPPATTCPNTALYAGWYNYGTYNDAFSWNPGSIGWDLDSSALADPRGGVWWGSNALARGVTVTSGPMAEPYLEGLARPSGVIRNLLEGANVADAFLRNTRWLKWMLLNVGDPLYTPFVNALTPFNAPLPANSLSLYPREAVGGATAISGILTLSEPAPDDGLTVTFSTSDSALSIPASVTVPAGESTVSFLLNAGAVTSSRDINVTASASAFSIANTQTLDPLLYGVDFAADSVQGGTSVKATLFLNASAPMRGAKVQLSSDSPDVASVHPSVYVPGGFSQADFVIGTSAVPVSTKVNITCSYAGATSVSTLTVTP